MKEPRPKVEGRRSKVGDAGWPGSSAASPQRRVAEVPGGWGRAQRAPSVRRWSVRLRCADYLANLPSASPASVQRWIVRLRYGHAARGQRRSVRRTGLRRVAQMVMHLAHVNRATSVAGLEQQFAYSPAIRAVSWAHGTHPFAR